MHALKIFNSAVAAVFFLCYAYQFLYIPISLLFREKSHKETKMHRFAVLIAARNEAAVIGDLLDSLRAQDYPREYFDLYVVADNCTDATAAVASAHGATVWQRYSNTHVGKGYALEFLLERLPESYDGYFVFDADNLVEPGFLSTMNRTFCDGYEIVTCYRNTKNYADNWISAGYGLWFLREAKYLSGARMKLGSSCAVSGTGFLFSQRILEECGGWRFFTLTEDIEFSIRNIVHGHKIGYCPDAVLYDEQPISFRQSWNQRLRWSKGYLQVFGKYGRQLLSGMLRGSFSCMDMTMNILPASILSAASLAVNGIALFILPHPGAVIAQLADLLLGMYGTFLLLGGITTITEWKNIHCSAGKKILYAFTFPVFMFTYLPIYLVSLFKKVTWTPIVHARSMSISQVRNFR